MVGFKSMTFTSGMFAPTTKLQRLTIPNQILLMVDSIQEHSYNREEKAQKWTK